MTTDDIAARLDRIEQLTIMAAKEALSFDEALSLTGFSRSHMYRLTSTNQVPHSKRCGRLFFKKKELEEWLLSERVATDEEIESRADTYIALGRAGNQGTQRPKRVEANLNHRKQ